MDTPSFFLSYNSQEISFPSQFDRIEHKNVFIAYKKQVRSGFYIKDTHDYILFAHVNIGFKNILVGRGVSAETLEKDLVSVINRFHWGFILLINKKTDQVLLFNDIYGIYPIFYSIRNKDLIISNDYDGLLKLQGDVRLDLKGTYDYFLFNYTLNNRTIFKNIFQLTGGSVIRGQNKHYVIEKNKHGNIIDYIDQKTKKHFEIDSLNRSLSEHLTGNIDPDLPVELALSGGFDSKVILSLLLNNKVDFSSFTYGLNDSVDLISAHETAKQLDFPHRLIELKPVAPEELDEQIKSFIKQTPGLPLILDLLSYELIKRNVSGSNIITGFMGGELINGPVIVSEVMLTRSAKSLTCAENLLSLKTNLIKDLQTNPFISAETYSRTAEEHISGLENYISNSTELNHTNLVRFLLNETYAKFFGVVFKNLMGEYNLINPFTDINFLSNLLKSKYRFTRFNPYTKSPIDHILSRRLYPKMIKRLHEPVIYSPLDRNYVMADLLYIHRLPVTIIRYLENHLLQKNKIKPSENSGSINRLKPLVTEKLNSSPVLDFEFIDKRKVKEAIRNLKAGESIPDHNLRKLILLLSLHYLHEIYGINY